MQTQHQGVVIDHESEKAKNENDRNDRDGRNREGREGKKSKKDEEKTVNNQQNEIIHEDAS